MKIVLMSIGSRGDVEPFLAIAEQYAAHGHEIICAFPEQFRELVEPLKYKFYGFDKAFLEMIEGEGGRAIMGSKGNWWQRITNLIKMGKEGIRLQKKMVKTQIAALEKEQPDRVFYYPKVTMPVLWSMAERCRCTLICP
ncbi:MAG: glycosyltransferase, partial [Saprospiraceae bacterium]